MKSSAQDIMTMRREEGRNSSNGFLYALGFFCLLNIASSEFEKYSSQETNEENIYALQILD